MRCPSVLGFLAYNPSWAGWWRSPEPSRAHEYRLPVPSWSDRNTSRPPVIMGLVSWVGRSARTRENDGAPLALTQIRPEVPPRYRFQRAGSCCELVSRAVTSLATAMSLAGPSPRRRGGEPVRGRAEAQAGGGVCG